MNSNTNYYSKSYLYCYLLACFIFSTHTAQVIPFDSKHWDIKAKKSKIKNYLGQKSLFIDNGFAFLKDVEFLNGVIEFDVAFSEERGFIGVAFRYKNPGNYEELYMRPHQSGNPDAIQYSPVINFNQSWQLYNGEGHGAAISYQFNQWMHVKIVISGKKGEVFIIDMNNPALVIHDIKRKSNPGKIALRVSNYAPGYFANFKYSLAESPKLIGQKKSTLKTSHSGIIKKWQVSNPFHEKELESFTTALDLDSSKLHWTHLIAEKTGLINLANVGNRNRGNTVLTKLTIHSKKTTLRKLDFGYSDRIKVFLNGKTLYSGTNLYRSRDYRYLGTIGYFDSVYLPLKQGENILMMAVTEEFGGWGLQGKFNDLSGLKLED